MRTPAEAGAIGMMPSMFLQTVLPYSQPFETNYDVATDLLVKAPCWYVTNNNYRLFIYSGSRVDENTGAVVRCGIPYGGTARYILSYIATEALRSGQRKVDFGRTQNTLLKSLNITSSGGKNGRIAFIQDQLWRIARCALTFEKVLADNAGDYGAKARNTGLADTQVFWFERDRSQQNVADLQYFGVELSKYFFQHIVDHSIPVDMRMLNVLLRSPLAMDLYVWLTYKADRLWEHDGKTHLFVPWTRLHEQFGCGYERVQSFAYEARRQLRKIKMLWPGLKIEMLRGRLVLFRCPPNVARS